MRMHHEPQSFLWAEHWIRNWLSSRRRVQTLPRGQCEHPHPFRVPPASASSIQVIAVTLLVTPRKVLGRLRCGTPAVLMQPCLATVTFPESTKRPMSEAIAPLDGECVTWKAHLRSSPIRTSLAPTPHSSAETTVPPIRASSVPTAPQLTLVPLLRSEPGAGKPLPSRATISSHGSSRDCWFLNHARPPKKMKSFLSAQYN